MPHLFVKFLAWVTPLAVHAAHNAVCTTIILMVVAGVCVTLTALAA